MNTSDPVAEVLRHTKALGEASYALEDLARQLRDARELLVECRKWEADDEYGEAIGPGCWTTAYADFRRRLDAAIRPQPQTKEPDPAAAWPFPKEKS